MENILPILIPIVAIIFLLRAIRLAPENSCYAVMNVSQFSGFRGPGLHFKWSGSTTKWIKIEIGERGKVTSEHLAKFQEIQLPIESNKKIVVGHFVRGTGFNDNAVEVITDRDQCASYVSENCGHENKIN